MRKLGRRNYARSKLKDFQQTIMVFSKQIPNSKIKHNIKVTHPKLPNILNKLRF